MITLGIIIMFFSLTCIQVVSSHATYIGKVKDAKRVENEYGVSYFFTPVFVLRIQLWSISRFRPRSWFNWFCFMDSSHGEQYFMEKSWGIVGDNFVFAQFSDG
jgi:hypothetical protein